MSRLDLTLALLVLLLAGTAIVLAVALRRAGLSLRAARASRAAALEARERVAELAANAERIRILREMHDVIAHSLAIMIAQADGGGYVVADTAAASRAFATIAETGRAALTDTRRILGILRQGEQAEPALAPTGHEQVDDLVAHARSAGLDVAVVRVGEARPLASGVAMARLRVCQESLTNVLKHAGVGARVIITESWLPESLALTVTDIVGGDVRTGAAVSEPLAGIGLGLIGMRERVELVGGTFSAEPTTDGYRVQAILPFQLPEGDAV